MTSGARGAGVLFGRSRWLGPLVRLTPAALAAIACGACGASNDTVKGPAPPPPVAAASLGTYSIALGRSVSDFMSGAVAPSWLTCADAATDIRATPASEKQKFAQLGPSPILVMSGLKVTLSSASREGQPGAFIDARSLTGPNQKVTWVELSGQSGAMRVPFDNRAKLSDLDAPLGPDLAAFALGLAHGCQAPLLEESDLDALPYEVSRDERDEIAVGMRRVRANLPVSCRAAESGAPPWEAHFHHADLVYRGAGHMARVRTRLHIEGASVCAGPVEIEQVIAGG